MIYYLFEDDKINADLAFEENEIYRFIALWHNGEDILSIAKKMKRTPLEIGLLIVDRAEVGEIKCRPNGIFA